MRDFKHSNNRSTKDSLTHKLIHTQQQKQKITRKTKGIPHIQ